MQINPSAATVPAKRYIWGPGIDFWALGGASILLWVLLLAADGFKDVSTSAAIRFGQISVVFSFLSVFVNYPHFMISYRFGYGRGGAFILKHWVALLAVPFAMIALFSVAYFFFFYDVSSNLFLLSLDRVLSAAGIDLGIRYKGALGREIILCSVWLMYFTVGWHYSKQVFGTLMVYARLRGYSFTALERRLLKGNLFAVALYQFIYVNQLLLSTGSVIDPRFAGITITGLGVPAWSSAAAAAILLGTTASVLVVFGRLFLVKKKKPDTVFLLAWASFLVWWIPVKNLPEFYALAVPFFHSLQYLAFASKLEDSKLRSRSFPQWRMVALVVLTLAAGVAGFEIVPAALDNYFATNASQTAWFFVSVAGVFINVHHFFIDSAVWKFDQVEVTQAFFGSTSSSPD